MGTGGQNPSDETSDAVHVELFHDISPLKLDRLEQDAHGQGDFLLNGFRNRDWRHPLFAFMTPNPETTHRRSGQVT